MGIKEISEKLKNNLSPGELSELHQKLAAEYGFLSDRMAEIQMNKPEKWAKLREESSSDKQTDLKYSLTPEGKEEIGYRYQLKAVEKMLSSIKTRISVLTEEARGTY